MEKHFTVTYVTSTRDNLETLILSDIFDGNLRVMNMYHGEKARELYEALTTKNVKSVSMEVKVDL